MLAARSGGSILFSPHGKSIMCDGSSGDFRSLVSTTGKNKEGSEQVKEKGKNKKYDMVGARNRLQDKLNEDAAK